LRRGHRPVVYAPVLGRTATSLQEQSIPVVDNLALITEPPDIIHGSHTPTIIESIVRFPTCPAIQVHHSTGYPIVGYPMSEPLFLPQVRRHVAVDQNTRDYLVSAAGVPPERIRLAYNAADLRRVPPRARPLRARPERALIFTKTRSQVPIVTEACRRAGITVQTLGRGVDRVVMDPERELVEYDLVFATARSALEAIAAGAATIVMDGRGLSEMATRDNFDRLRLHNFGRRSLLHEVTIESIACEIAKYDAAEAAALSDYARPLVDIEHQLDLFERLYFETIEEFAASPNADADLIAALPPVLHRWLPRFPGTDWPWQFEKAALLDQLDQLDKRLADAARERNESEKGLDAARARVSHLERQSEELRVALQRMASEGERAAAEGELGLMAARRELAQLTVQAEREGVMLREQLATAQAEIARVSAQAEGEGVALCEQLAAAQAEIARVSAQAEGERAALCEQLAAAQAEIARVSAQAEREGVMLREQLATAQAEIARVSAQAECERVALREQLAAARGEHDRLLAEAQAAIASMERSPFWQLRNRLRTMPRLHRLAVAVVEGGRKLFG
jgi:hypothetical protein